MIKRLDDNDDSGPASKLPKLQKPTDFLTEVSHPQTHLIWQ